MAKVQKKLLSEGYMCGNCDRIMKIAGARSLKYLVQHHFSRILEWKYYETEKPKLKLYVL